MTSIVEVLPPEIIGAIIDILANYEHPNQSLRACSLACQAFLPICQQKIFHSIVLIEVKRQSAFVDLAKRNPGIVDYVRRLEYMPAPADIKASTPSPIVTLLQRFTKLERVVITFWSSIRQDWRKLPSFMRSSLQSLLHLPSITSIHLMYIRNLDHADLLACTNIRELELYDVAFAEWDDSPPLNTPVKSIKPHRLALSKDLTILNVVKMSRPYYGDGTSILDLRELRNITVQMNDLGLATEIFKYTYSLETLHFVFEYTDKKLELIVPMVYTSSKGLQHFSLKTFRFMGISNHFNVLSSIRDVLQGFAAGNVISVFKLEFDLFFGGHFILGDEWGVFDEVLLVPHGWPSLTQFDLKIYAYVEKKATIDTLRRLPETYLRGLSSSGSIKFNFSVIDIADSEDS